MRIIHILFVRNRGNIQLNNTFVIVELNEHLRVDNCYVFSDEKEAAKYTLLLQFNDCNFMRMLSEFRKQGYSDGAYDAWYDPFELVLSLFKNGEYISAYEKFSACYWEISYKPDYYFKVSDGANLSELNQFQSEIEHF